jgi:hypothetical protein
VSARRLSIQEHLVVLKNRKMSKLKKNFSQTNVPAEILLCPAPAASIWCTKIFFQRQAKRSQAFVTSPKFRGQQVTTESPNSYECGIPDDSKNLPEKTPSTIEFESDGLGCGTLGLGFNGLEKVLWFKWYLT